jgi:hypothetical protein
MNVKSKVTLGLVGLVMGMVCVFTVAAQEKLADNMQIVLEKVRADKKLLVAENMQLTETEAKAFWPVYDQYQDELFLDWGHTTLIQPRSYLEEGPVEVWFRLRRG